MAAARNFQELIALLRRAETAMISHGISDASQRAMAFRGIYYGTAWSRDFTAERSQIRNLGFTIFTGFGMPPDPRPIIGVPLFTDLQRSQDIRDHGLAIDVGHIMIGLEARNNYAARSTTIPTQGGTGLEISTWLGDLGGGAANLAWRRARTPLASVSSIFSSSGSDYGASINLEGDVGAFIIGSTSTTVTAPSYGRGGVADLFDNYLPARGVTPLWRNRAKNFLLMHGGTFTSNTLSNRSTVVTTFKDKIFTFSIAYMTQRYLSSDLQRAANACAFLEGAATEIAEVFVSALERNIISPSRIISGGRFPRPTARGTCNSTVLSAGTYQQAIDESLRSGREAANDLLRGILGD